MRAAKKHRETRYKFPEKNKIKNLNFSLFIEHLFFSKLGRKKLIVCIVGAV